MILKFPDFSLTFEDFLISHTILQNSLTFPWPWRRKKQISLTFPWPVGTLRMYVFKTRAIIPDNMFWIHLKVNQVMHKSSFMGASCKTVSVIVYPANKVWLPIGEQGETYNNVVYYYVNNRRGT